MATKSLVKVSIIILNFNGLRDSIECISSIVTNKYPNIEIVFIDNGSTINEAEIIGRKYGKLLRVFRLDENLGFTGGNNWALKKAKGKYILLLNNDTVVTKHWLNEMVQVLENDDKIAVVQPKILDFYKRKYFDYAGAAGGYIDKYGYPFTRGRIFNTRENDKGQYDNGVDIFWASGACCLIRKSIIKKVGGLFDERFFNYMEEIDFCWRLWNKGYKVRFCPKSIIYHKGASTSGKDLLNKRYWEHRNNLLILRKNLNRRDYLKVLLIRAIFELTTYLHYLLSGNYIYIKSLFKTHMYFIRQRSSFNKIPKNINNNLKLPIYPGSIVFDYYILKRHKYSNLNWSPKGNISYIIFNTKKSGGLRVVYEQTNKFISKGYAVNIYKIGGKNNNWMTMSSPIRNIFLSFLYFKPDILLSTFWPTSYVSLFCKGIKKYYFIQDWEPNFHKSFLIKIAVLISYRLPLNKITINNYCYNAIKQFALNSKHKVFKIKLALINKNIFIKRSFEVQKKMGRIIKIISVLSWYNPHKGPDILIKVIGELKKRYNIHFTLVTYEDKPLTPLVDKFISNANPFQVASLYRSSDILLITSRSEGFLSTGLEAMASGCLVMATDVPGVNDYAKNMYNAILFKDINTMWKNDNFSKLLRDRQLLKRIIINGYNTAILYNSEYIADDMEKIFFLKNYEKKLV